MQQETTYPQPQNKKPKIIYNKKVINNKEKEMEETLAEPVSISDLLSKYKFNEKTTKHRDQRAELIQQFLDEINRERAEEGRFKPQTYKVILLKVKHITSTSDLYAFYKQCLDGKSRYGSFSKVFWGALKVKK